MQNVKRKDRNTWKYRNYPLTYIKWSITKIYFRRGCYYDKQYQCLLIRMVFWTKQHKPNIKPVEAHEKEGIQSKTSEELKNMVSLLGSAYKEDTNNINNGYPILNWQ